MFKLYYKAVAIVLGITLTGLLVTTLVMVPDVQNKILTLESKNAKLQLDKAIAFVKSNEQELKDYRESAMSLHKIEVKSITQIAISILDTYYQEAKRSGSKEIEERKKKEAIALINKLRYGNDNYVYLTDENIILLSHPIKKFIGFDFNKVKGAKGKYFAREMAKKADLYGEGFVRYWWPKSIGGIAKEKLSYTVKFKPWNIYVGTGVYIDEIETNIAKKKEKIKNELAKYLGEIQIADHGYLFMFNEKGKLLIHPDKKLLSLKDTSKLKNPVTGTYLFDDYKKALQSNEPYIYNWNHPSDLQNYTYEKISWINHNKYFDWYIVSTAYIDDIHATTLEVTKKQYLIAFITLIISLVLGMLLFKKILQPLSDLSESSLAVQKGDFSNRNTIKQNDEIGQLAKEFNIMLDTIEDHVKNLDEKVREKTIELEEVNSALSNLAQMQVEKLSKQDKILYKQSQYAALGEMMDAIGHQWKQPISVISLLVTQLAIKKDVGIEITDNDIEEMTNDVLEQINHLSETIDEFRQFFRPNQTLETIDLLNHLESTLSLMENTLKDNKIKVSIDYEKALEVSCLPHEFKHIFINLINNAKDAFNENNTKNRKLSINFFEEEENVIIHVKDNAGGIAKEVLKDIFKVNFTTKDDSAGSGVGLYMSKQIIEKLDGTIEVQNSDNGALFIIKVPKKAS